MVSQPTAPTILIFLFAVSSLFLTGSLLSLYSNTAAMVRNEQYTEFNPRWVLGYKWEDYPLEVPLVLEKSFEVTIEESVHYPVVGPEAHDEWMNDSPHGEGTFRLGPQRHYSTVSMFHQLHCLRIFRAAIAIGDSYPMKDQKKHLNHCLNYLREVVLCTADTTLEPGDFTTRNFELHRTGATHMCRDHRQLYNLTENDWVDWYIYMFQNNISLSALRDQEIKDLGNQITIT